MLRTLLLFAISFSLFFRKVISLPILFRVSFIGLDACAPHFASLGSCFAHFYVIPGLTGYLVYVLGIWDGISEMLLSWELLVVVLKSRVLVLGSR